MSDLTIAALVFTGWVILALFLWAVVYVGTRDERD